MTNRGQAVIFSKEGVRILKNDIVVPEDMVILRGDRTPQGLFVVDLEVITTAMNSSNTALVNEIETESPAMTLHRKMGHLGIENLKKLPNLSCGLKLKITNQDIKKTCVVCIMSKLSKMSHNKTRTKATAPLRIIHTDLCGPISPATHNGKSYYVLFLDEYTHFCTIFLMERKSETLKYLQQYVSEAENFWNKKVHTIRCDNGMEYINSATMEWARSKGIVMDTTNPTGNEINIPKYNNIDEQNTAKSLSEKEDEPNQIEEHIPQTQQSPTKKGNSEDLEEILHHPQSSPEEEINSEVLEEVLHHPHSPPENIFADEMTETQIVRPPETEEDLSAQKRYSLRDRSTCKMPSKFDDYILDLSSDEEANMSYISRSDQGICLHQTSYATQLLEKYEMSDCRSVPTPMDITKQKKDHPSPRRQNPQNYPYRQIVGSLLYLSNKTRPDLSFSVNHASRYVSNPTAEDIIKIKRILRYLKATVDLGIFYSSQLTPEMSILRAFSDSDYAQTGGEDKRKSTTGYTLIFAGGPVSWASHKQAIVATATSEAEYIAAAECVKELQYVSTLFSELTVLRRNVKLCKL
ncbi:Retrovirus-related Pol polyprotein from transposon TNT 1-94 [Frankliniella fusca]|uniref:Retrovirus-related Pol polyprotein from transposon TNT 1-94 n=1 Tax=Frankliniella fusca TaxID=407009 RepID=A0AAE1GU13_9NEOP|nr:Retrovirus-related Pol polyprotein from transposon TNT 1-94 [Frankliniella fusca]